MKGVVNNREIEYGDCIIHTTTSNFSFWDRVRIFLGKKVIITSKIYTAEVANTIASEASTYVQKFKKSKNVGMMHSPSIEFNRDMKINSILKK